MTVKKDQRKKMIREKMEKLNTTDPHILGIKEFSKQTGATEANISKYITEIKEEGIDIDERINGVITSEDLVIDDTEVKKIWFKSERNPNGPLWDVKYFPDRRITKTSRVYRDPDTGRLEAETLGVGMTREELKRFFPARLQNQSQGHIFNVTEIIRSIMYEVYIKDAIPGNKEEGNVRDFWYIYLKSTLLNELGLVDNQALGAQLNTAWKSVIISGLVEYPTLKIIGGKESGRISTVQHSPFPHIIIAVEKEDYLDALSWIPQLFNCTLMTAGGDPSRAVTWQFIYELKNLGVDLDKDFYMCTISDLDPAGYYIERAFQNQLEDAIHHYGGIGKVTIRRLFVKKDQVTPALLESQAIPWVYGKVSTKKSIDAQRETNWQWFCEQTKTEDDPDGGLYITVPTGWTGKIVEKDGKSMVRALLEINAFPKRIITDKVVEELLYIIRKYDLDETKIIIPEVMRIFDEIREKVSEEIHEQWEKQLIGPLKKKFEKDMSKWEDEINTKKQDDKEGIENRYDNWVEEQEENKRKRVPELFEEKDKIKKDIEEQEIERNNKINDIEEGIDGQIEALEEQIAALDKEKEERTDEIREKYKEPLDKLTHEKDSVKRKIDEKCEDIDDAIEELYDERREKLDRVDEDYDFRMGRYEEFKENHLATFNPLEQSLKWDIRQRIMEMEYHFTDLENRSETHKTISALYTMPKLLLDENMGYFNHPLPVFKGDKLLERAAKSKDLNIGKVRDKFPVRFLESMKQIIEIDTNDFTFELPEDFEMEDLSHDLKEAMEETEKDLEEQEAE